MRAVKTLLCLALLITLSGCDPGDTVVGSIQPLFTPADLVFDSALAGVWKDPGENGGESVVLQPRGENAYTMIVGDEKGREVSRYEARLVDLHGESYLDLLPEGPAVDPQNFQLDFVPSQTGNDFTPHLVPVAEQLLLSIEADESGEQGRAYKVRFVRLHWFYKVWTDGNVMRLTALNQEWLRGEIKEGKILINHQLVGESQTDFLLTASTSDLQQLVLDYAFDPKAFPEDASSGFQLAPEE
jgi:hypothetical protein